MQDTRELNDRLNQCLPALCSDLGLRGNQDANELVAYNPTRPDKKLGSFRICLSGSNVGIWKDFATDDGGYGGLSLIRYVRRVEWKEVYRYAREFLGCADSGKKGTYKKFSNGERGGRAKGPKDYTKIAQAIWLEAEKSLKDTVADQYLVGRGLDLRLLRRQPAVLRFSEKCWHGKQKRNFPALVSAVHTNGGEFCAVHRIYLPDEYGEVPTDTRKSVLGSYRGAYIRIWRGVEDDKLMPAFSCKEWKTDTVYVTEGVEDALAVAILKPEFRVVAGIGVTNFKNLKFPPCIKNIVVVADNDEAGGGADKALGRAVEQLISKGYELSIARSPVGKDFADAVGGMSHV